MQHYQAAMRVLTYVSQSRARRLRFTPDATRGFEVYVDSNWATHFSCSGAMYFFHGCLFHWFSKMQHSVSLSSAEAEFFGAMLAAKDLLFLRDTAQISAAAAIAALAAGPPATATIAAAVQS